jgi:hypothetical protein
MVWWLAVVVRVGSGDDGAGSSELLKRVQRLVRRCSWLRRLAEVRVSLLRFGSVQWYKKRRAHSTTATATVTVARTRCEENYLLVLPRPADCCSSILPAILPF